ncbi:MAG: hypothetical protein U1G07_13010 [Verrucomicrobiota bacterium]
MKKLLLDGHGCPNSRRTALLAAACLLLTRERVWPAAWVVSGQSNPWLAGMPAGTRASGLDIAPAQSPVEVTNLQLTAGMKLTFQATGGVANSPERPLSGPDGNSAFISTHAAGSENGIASAAASRDALVGVFLGAEIPSLSPPPVATDFSDEAARDYAFLAPLLKQVFFIGDGQTSRSNVQQVIVPTNATRLFLGTMDGSNWNNNRGSFNVTVSATSEASAGRIDFETLPDGTPPVREMIISNQFQVAYGVTFRLDDGTPGGAWPRLAEAGGTTLAFIGPRGMGDQPAAGQDVGRFFLADAIRSTPRPLEISYASPVAVAGGYLLDLDREESWRIRAFSSTGQLLSERTVTAGDDPSGKGLATPWTVQFSTARIQRIRLEYVGADPDVGLALDNFWVAQAPPVSELTDVRVGLAQGPRGLELSVVGRPATQRARGGLIQIETSSGVLGHRWQSAASFIDSSDDLVLPMADFPAIDLSAGALFLRLRAGAP